VNPARHGVIGNNYFDRATGKMVALIPDPVYKKEEIVKTPTIYDVAKAAGLKTAAIIWPASRGAPTLDWTVPDVFTDDLFQGFAQPKEILGEFKEAAIPYERQNEWCKSGGGNERDRMYVQMFNLVLRKHHPNVGLLHLVEVDHVEHAKGPQTPEAYAAVKFADDRVREVWEQLKETYPGKATLIVTADHGFFPYRQQILPNVMLRKAGLLEVKGMTISGGQARALSQGGASFIYVLDKENRGALIDRIAGMFKDAEGVDVVIPPAEFKKYGLADPSDDPRMPDLVLSAKKGYAFSDTAGGELTITPQSPGLLGTHGYDPNQPDMHAAFVAWGAGIQTGAVVEKIDNLDVAPTMAALMGLTMKEVEGKVIEGILAK
jgi:predicted AlkP superfamily pyrophosphatase or phosphodiesterase